ncbi:MAG: hypothetical protein R2849_14890 [Thermomicrobiales bacterium]
MLDAVGHCDALDRPGSSPSESRWRPAVSEQARLALHHSALPGEFAEADAESR